MKYYISFLFVLFSFIDLSAQKTVQMSAVKANDYGVSYSLPKTGIELTVEYTKYTKKAGEFYRYADSYLNISNPIIEDEAFYKLDAITAVTKGIVDKDKSYLVEFRSNTTAPYVTLTESGLLCAINSDYSFPISVTRKKNKTVGQLGLDPYSYLSEEILRAGSTAKQAELIAKQIYRLRESRTNILTGEADNMPPDGEAYRLVMSQLEEQEKALMSMFIGSETSQKGSQTFELIPTDVNLNEEIAARFSEKLGLVDKNDLGGSPIYLSLINKNPVVKPSMTDKELRDMEKKFSEGIVYNIPNKAALLIHYKGELQVDEQFEIVQYGTQEVLTKNMFDNNKQAIKIIFYPDLGSIKQIIQ